MARSQTPRAPAAGRPPAMLLLVLLGTAVRAQTAGQAAAVAAFNDTWVSPDFRAMGLSGNGLLSDRLTSGSGSMAFSTDAPPGFWRSIEYAKAGAGPEPRHWAGWRVGFSAPGWVRVSCWLKFLSAVPPASASFGFQIQGTLQRWALPEDAGTWFRVSAVGPALATAGHSRGDLVALTFESVEEPLRLRFANLTYEVFDANPEEDAEKTRGSVNPAFHKVWDAQEDAGSFTVMI